MQSDHKNIMQLTPESCYTTRATRVDLASLRKDLEIMFHRTNVVGCTESLSFETALPEPAIRMSMKIAPSLVEWKMVEHTVYKYNKNVGGTVGESESNSSE